ncbi:MAG: tellurite resistance TerB family protein [Planctomycetota bacterium]|jgi:tellurite resistance protein
MEQHSTDDAVPDLRVLNCRVRPGREKQGNSFFDVFNVEICGRIRTSSQAEHIVISVFINDITNGAAKAQPIYSPFKQMQREDSPVFCYKGDLGKLPSADTTLSDWTSVARISIDWLTLPRSGTRKLHFAVSILSRDTGRQLACAERDFVYENLVFGYVELEENLQRTRTLAVALAFAVSAADGKLYKSEVEVIKAWARGKMNASQASDEARHKFEEALESTVSFFGKGNQVDSRKICKELVEIAPLAERYDILELCLRVIQANGKATAEELNLLKQLAACMEVDADRWRAMVQRILPSVIYETKDVELILGVKSSMGREETRQHLNKEYRKWNARVTSSDPQVQSQADSMLKFIADARKEYIA